MVKKTFLIIKHIGIGLIKELVGANLAQIRMETLVNLHEELSPGIRVC